MKIKLTLLQQTALTKSFIPSSFLLNPPSSNLYVNNGFDSSLQYKYTVLFSLP